jgi:aminoglycoside 3-N-acetyltransferase
MLRLAKRLAERATRPLTQPRLTGETLADSLLAIGVRRGGLLLVHSSLSALGYVAGGARTVIGGLMEAVGPEGTLIAPTHTWEWMDAGYRTFDADATPGCVGVIPEALRSMPDAVRSLHPTHSIAAIGPHARSLADGHELCATPCGQGTPYAKLLDAGGQLLLLGVGLESNTVFHTVEAIAGVDYLLREEAEEFLIIDQSGAFRRLAIRQHRAGVARRFGAFEGMLVDMGIASRGRVGRAPTLLVDGAGFRDVMVALLRKDPGLLLATPSGRGTVPAHHR